jgi:hypothetical protein
MKIVADKKEWFKKVFNENYEYILNYLFYLSGDSKFAMKLYVLFYLPWQEMHFLNQQGA